MSTILFFYKCSINLKKLDLPLSVMKDSNSNKTKLYHNSVNVFKTDQVRPNLHVQHTVIIIGFVTQL